MTTEIISAGLVDFSMLKQGCVSGLSTNEYNRLIENQANDRIMDELPENISVDCLFDSVNDIDKLSSDEQSLSSQMQAQIQEEMNKFERSHRSESSVIQERVHVKKFEEFLQLKNLDCDFKAISASDLNFRLRYFYSQLKKNNGECYSGSSLLCIRAALHRHFSTSPLNREFNIMQDKEFVSSNNMLKSKISEWLKSGKRTNHFPHIEETDQQKLALYFDQSTPTILQQEIWYNIMYYFGNRGREGIRDLTVENFDFAFDSNDEEYVYMIHDIHQKNVKPSCSKKDFDNCKQSRMYANKREPSICPVIKFRLYLSKIPSGCKNLFPKPKKVGKVDWYQSKQVIGKTLLGTMMKTISKDAKLSKEYTNHCIRPTVVTNLREDGFDRVEVCAITGHKCEKSIERYDKTCKERTLQRMSNSLGNRKRKFENVSVETNCFNSSNKSGNGLSFFNCQFNNCSF